MSDDSPVSACPFCRFPTIETFELADGTRVPGHPDCADEYAYERAIDDVAGLDEYDPRDAYEPHSVYDHPDLG